MAPITLPVVNILPTSSTSCPAMAILNEHMRFSSTGRGPMNYSRSSITLNSRPHADSIFGLELLSRTMVWSNYFPRMVKCLCRFVAAVCHTLVCRCAAPWLPRCVLVMTTGIMIYLMRAMKTRCIKMNYKALNRDS